MPTSHVSTCGESWGLHLESSSLLMYLEGSSSRWLKYLGSAIHLGDVDEVLGPSFGLAQSWLLWHFRAGTGEWILSLCVSSFLSVTLPFKWMNEWMNEYFNNNNKKKERGKIRGKGKKMLQLGTAQMLPSICLICSFLAVFCRLRWQIPLLFIWTLLNAVVQLAEA